MSRHTKEKRKKQKLKLEAEVKNDNVVFDVLSLLKSENFDSKPNVAKFLKAYVKCISGNPKVKPIFYPTYELIVNKWYVKFFDGHELIFDISLRNKRYRYILCYELDDVEFDEKDIDAIEMFFLRLVEFGFIEMKSDAMLS